MRWATQPAVRFCVQHPTKAPVASSWTWRTRRMRRRTRCRRLGRASLRACAHPARLPRSTASPANPPAGPLWPHVTLLVLLVAGSRWHWLPLGLLLGFSIIVRDAASVSVPEFSIIVKALPLCLLLGIISL